MVYKKHVPRLFLVSGLLLIFLSVFLLWATLTSLISGERIYEYGYDRPGLYILFILSLLPLLLYEIGIKFTKQFLLIPFIELILLAVIEPVYLLMYTVETGIGMYIAGLGILFQFIGVIIAVLFERLNKELMFYLPQYVYS